MSTTCLLNSLNCPLPRRIHLLLPGYVSQEDFQSSTGFDCGQLWWNLYLWYVCINVHHRRWSAVDIEVWAAPAVLRCPGTVPDTLFASHSSAGTQGKQWTAASFLQPDLTLTLLLSERNIHNFPRGFFSKSRNEHRSSAPYQPVRRKDQRHLHAVFKTAISVEQWCLKSVNQVLTELQWAGERIAAPMCLEMWCW